MVDRSGWPVQGSIGVLGIFVGGVGYMHRVEGGKGLMMVGMVVVLMTMRNWWGDIIKEGREDGRHTREVVKGLKIGVGLFIISEVMFFVSFFWGYLDGALAPSVEIGREWPPQGLTAVGPWGLALSNTLMLLTSGMTATIVHKSMIVGDSIEARKWYMMTIGLGLLFTGCQLYEYITARVTIADGIYGSAFYVTTGFHGLHVLIGTICLITGAQRVRSGRILQENQVGIEGGFWYWHFVDVVWIMLYGMVYWKIVL